MSAANTLGLEDATALKWWTTAFGSAGAVPVAAFVAKLKSQFPDFAIDYLPVVASHVIATDPSQLAVSTKELNMFNARFGPAFADAFKKCKSNLFEADGKLVSWFHGNITRETAEAALKASADQKSSKGLFLIRFSEKYPNKLTLAYSRIEDKKFFLKNVLIHNTPLGYSLEEQPKASHAFPTVLKLVEAKQLTTPVVSTLWKQLYEKKKEVVVEQSNYVAFTPTANPLQPTPHTAAAAAAPSNYVAFSPLMANIPTPTPASNAAPQSAPSNYVAFNPALLSAAGGGAPNPQHPAVAASGNKPASNYEAFNVGMLPAGGGAHPTTGTGAAATPSNYESFGAAAGLDIEAALRSQRTTASPAAAASANSNYIPFDPSQIPKK